MIVRQHAETAVHPRDHERPIFVFLHGLGSSEADLCPLAHEFEQRGYGVESLHLPIHWSRVDAIQDRDVDGIIEGIRIEMTRHDGRPVFLIGFSAGASLAILYAQKHEVAGVFAISAFLGPRHVLLARLIEPLAKHFPSARVPRFPQTTVKATRAQLATSPPLSIHARQIAIAIGVQAFTALGGVKCPVLFFHSFDDKVSSYDKVADAFKACPSSHGRMISFDGLNHYLQFDIPSFRICEFVLRYFELIDDKHIAEVQEVSATDMLKIYADERRHWSLVLFQVIVGSFTVFGFLLYNSLSELAKDPTLMPIYLASYSIVSSVYIVLSMLYFFYSNRADVYIKMYIEPLTPLISWSTFRTNPFVLGRGSQFVTRVAAVPLVVLPSLVSVISILTCFTNYYHDVTGKGDVKLGAFIVVALLSAFSVVFAFQFSRFTGRWLRIAPAAERTDQQTEAVLHQLYRSISPGCVRQPRPLKPTHVHPLDNRSVTQP